MRERINHERANKAFERANKLSKRANKALGKSRKPLIEQLNIKSANTLYF